VLDAAGVVQERGEVRTTPAAFEARFRAWPASRCALEVGTHSPWVQPLLRAVGHEVLVANARKLRLIFAGDRKNDRLDAEKLARVARMDPALLAPIEHRGPAVLADRAQLRARDALVRCRTILVNHARGVCKGAGARLPRCAPERLPAHLAAVPEALRPALEPILSMIAEHTTRLRAYDRALVRVARAHYPITAALRAVPGVGSLTALAYVLMIEDPHRFKESRTVPAYLGLCPRQRQSGASDPECRISKAGDGFVRRLLVQSAQRILQKRSPDTALQRFGRRLAARGDKIAKRKAVVAVARKLATLLHRLWVTGRPYRPFPAGPA
jgi:transposase